MGVAVRSYVYRGFVFVFRKLFWFRAWLLTSVSAPLMFMYCLMLLVNTLLRDTKDALLVTSQAGVEAIPILKSWAVIPVSFVYFVVYYKLSTLFNARQMFMLVLFGFTSFYFMFAIFLYPRQHLLVPTGITESLSRHLPEKAKPVQHLVENWLLGLFYVISELWASAVCQFMFWQVANAIVSVEHAKSIYPLIGACGNLGMVLAGHLLRVFANQRDVVAANAYLRISGAGKGNVEAGSIDDEGAKASIKQLTQDNLYTDSLGYSVFSEWLSPLTGASMNPLDQAWQGTLIGIALLLAFSSVLIMVAYDSIHARKALYMGEDYSNRARSGSEQQYSGVSSIESKGTKVKRRTGSGGYDAHHSATTTTEIGSPKTNGIKKYPASDKFWDVNGTEKSATRKDSEVKKAKGKVSMIEGLRTLSKSTPLRCAATLVASYGVAISLVEVSWKGQVKKALEKPNDYSRFMGMFWTVTGLVSMLFMLIGRVILHRIGYAPAVLFTPVCMAIAGSLFFIVSIIQDVTDSPVSGPRTPDTVPWAAYFGGSAVLFAKSAKYAFFDATKEIIFIPLDENSKNLGKAAIDVVAYRLSKSGGSVILQLVIFFFGSISSSVGCIPISIIFGFVVFAWIHAALGANKFINRNGDPAPPEEHIV